MDEPKTLSGGGTDDVGDKGENVQRTFGQGGKDTTQNLLGVSASGGFPPGTVDPHGVLRSVRRTRGIVRATVRR